MHNHNNHNNGIFKKLSVCPFSDAVWQPINMARTIFVGGQLRNIYIKLYWNLKSRFKEEEFQRLAIFPLPDAAATKVLH